MLGLRRHTVHLAPHDPEWANTFRLIRDQITSATQVEPDRIHHIGSTSVPGLPAKPIIDIDIALLGTEDVDEVASNLERLGWIDRGTGAGGVGRLLVWETAPDIRTAHIHITPFDSPWWRSDLAFRDALRDSPDLRERYAATKSALASQFARDRPAYRAAKDPFIRTVLDSLNPES